MTPELSMRLALLREKAISGQPLTREEMREAIAGLRQVRSGAAVAARAERTTSRKLPTAPVNVAELLKGLKR